MGVTAAIAAVASVGYSVYSGERASSAQNKAQDQAKRVAQQQADATDQATNRANQKSPDSSALLSAVEQAGKGGVSGTMLTGAQGVDPNSLSLGKNTLLGG